MNAIAFALRAEAHRRKSAWLVLALVIGLGLGAVMALASGARRTQTAYDRFLADAAPSDILLQASADFGPPTIDLRVARRLPQLSEATVARGYFAYARLDDGSFVAPGEFFTMSDPDDVLGHGIDRGRLLHGRYPDPSRRDEVVVGFDLARQWDVEVGDTFELGFLRAESVIAGLASYVVGIPDRLATPEIETSAYEQLFDGPRPMVEIVGVAADPLGFPPQSGSLVPLIYLAPSFAAEHGADLWSQEFLYARLVDDATAADFQTAAEQAFPGAQIRLSAAGQTQARSVQRVIDLDVRSLWILTLVMTITVAITALQLNARLTAREDSDHLALVALGVDRSFFQWLAASRSALIAGVAVVIGVAEAVLASRWFPIGVARVAEPVPGISVDPLVLGIGSLTAMALLPIGAFVTMRHRLSKSSSPMDSAGNARIQPRLPVAVGVGVHFTRSSTPRDATVPVRSAVITLGTAMASLVFVLTFGAGFTAVLNTPHAYGWNWDAKIGAPGTPDFHQILVGGLSRNPDVNSIAVGTVVSLDVDGERVEALAMENAQGAIEPSLLAGDAPSGKREVALGTLTLRSINASIGDSVTLSVGDQAIDYTVTGRVVVPELGDGGQLGRGAFLPLAGLEELVATPVRNVVLVTFSDRETSQGDSAIMENIAAAVSPFPVEAAADGNELLATSEVGNGGPITFALLAAPVLVAAATTTHVLVTSVRRRKRDLAILRILGFGNRQIRTTIVSEAITLSLIAAAIGVPVGIIGGRAAWRAFAESLGVTGRSPIPVLLIAAVVSLQVGLGALIALVPGSVATRVQLSESLRTD